MARSKRSWWQKKTNWAIIVGIGSQLMALNPVTAAYTSIVLKIATALGVYGIADRAGKEPEMD